MKRRVPSPALAATFALMLAALVSAGASCQSDPHAEPCRNIPAGGCPGFGTTNCKDPSCVAIYTCQIDGTWVFDTPCPAHDGGPPLDASAEADAPSPRDVDIDAPPGSSGGPGCPDLQAPDCPLNTALVCPVGCCDCVDLFVCADGGWGAWGQCIDGGISQGD